MAAGDTIKVIGIEKVTKDLDAMFKEFTVKRKIVDKSSRESLRPLLKEAKAIAPIAEKDLPSYIVKGSRRKAIPRGTLQRAIKFRKRKSWIGLIIEHGNKAFKNDAWYWRFAEYGYVHWVDGKLKNKHTSFGAFRRLIAGTQKRVLNKWMRQAKVEMKKRIPKMDVKVK